MSASTVVQKAGKQKVFNAKGVKVNDYYIDVNGCTYWFNYEKINLLSGAAKAIKQSLSIAFPVWTC